MQYFMTKCLLSKINLIYAAFSPYDYDYMDCSPHGIFTPATNPLDILIRHFIIFYILALFFLFLFFFLYFFNIKTWAKVLQL